MTDRDRLINIFSKFADGTYNGSGTIIDGTKVDDVVDELLANGVFILPEDLRGTEDFSISAFIEAMQMYKEKDRYIKPPCKVGDKVYIVGVFTGQVIPTVVIGFDYTANDMFLHLDNSTFVSVVYQLGKTVFLTKEEAEEKLKELKDNAQ